MKKSGGARVDYRESWETTTSRKFWRVCRRKNRKVAWGIQHTIQKRIKSINYTFQNTQIIYGLYISGYHLVISLQWYLHNKIELITWAFN